MLSFEWHVFKPQPSREKKMDDKFTILKNFLFNSTQIPLCKGSIN